MPGPLWALGGYARTFGGLGRGYAGTVGDLGGGVCRKFWGLRGGYAGTFVGLGGGMPELLRA